MKEVPALFNTEMVKAILEDRKTNTRRLVKFHGSTPDFYKRDKFYKLVNQLNEKVGLFAGFYCDSDVFMHEGEKHIDAIYFKAPCEVDDILWVRETWRPKSAWSGSSRGCEIEYKAGGENKIIDDEIIIKVPWTNKKWRPSIHMPRKAARIFLKVTDVRVERLQEITEIEAQQEWKTAYYEDVIKYELTAKQQFSELWDSIYKNWGENPWVWVIQFERVVDYGH